MATLELHVIAMAEENTWSLISFFQELAVVTVEALQPIVELQGVMVDGVHWLLLDGGDVRSWYCRLELEVGWGIFQVNGAGQRRGRIWKQCLFLHLLVETLVDGSRSFESRHDESSC